MPAPTPDQLTDLGRQVSSLIAKVDMLQQYGETVAAIYGAILLFIAGILWRLGTTAARLPTREDLNNTVGHLQQDFKEKLAGI
jgi:hypothetical protein